MDNTLAHGERALTILAGPQAEDRLPSASTMPSRKPGAASRRTPAVPRRSTSRPAASAKTQDGPVAEGFYRDLVWNLRNGVLAVTREGNIAVMNEVAYRILGLQPGKADIGLPYAEVLRHVPDVT